MVDSQRQAVLELIAVEALERQGPMAVDSLASRERNALCEAAGIDFLKVIRWIADNRDSFTQIIEGIKKLIAAFNPPNAAGADDSQPGPEAINLALIAAIVQALGPFLSKLLDLFKRDAEPAPQPTV